MSFEQIINLVFSLFLLIIFPILFISLIIYRARCEICDTSTTTLLIIIFSITLYISVIYGISIYVNSRYTCIQKHTKMRPRVSTQQTNYMK